MTAGSVGESGVLKISTGLRFGRYDKIMLCALGIFSLYKNKTKTNARHASTKSSVVCVRRERSKFRDMFRICEYHLICVIKL